MVVFLMSFENSLFPNFNCGGMGMLTLSLDTHEESSSCEYDKSLNNWSIAGMILQWITLWVK